jgi:outer membrane protein assembly factor BamB
VQTGCFFTRWSRSVLFSSLTLLLVSVTSAADSTRAEPGSAEQATRILGGAGYQGGLIVHLGCGDGRLTAALGAADQAVVQGLDSDPALVAEARAHIRLLGRYGRVSVGAFDGKQLPYADNLVNLVVVSGGGSQVSDEEIQRVLCPGGVAWYESEIECRKVEGHAPDAGTGGHKAVKPWPEELDQWTHFLYDASGNAVSRDRRVGPPQRLQWEGGPRWSRSHETDMSLTATVTSGGRIFHTLDEGPIGIHETPRERRQLPDKCSLVARDAFNGIELWKRPLPDWGSAAWDNARWRWGISDQLWSSPLTLPRRLVADGDRVYVTLGFRACVSELDAATGKTLREFPQTHAAEEIVLSQPILVARVREASSAASGESIMAIEIESGDVLWRKHVPAVADLTLAVHDERVCFHDTSRLVALDLRSGRLLWQTEERPPGQRRIAEGTLVMANDTVIFAAAPGMEARRSTDGGLLWRTKTNTSFRGVPDVFVIGDLAWAGTLTTTGLDRLTGEVARQIDPGHLFTGGHHARCHRGKATENYLLWSKRGVEFLDLQADGHQRHDWVRGTCRYGIVPANGLLYAPPHPCFCYPGVKLTGFNALAAAGTTADAQAPSATPARLELGPAYAKTSHSVGSRPAVVGEPSDWPTYRRDNARSGSAGTLVPSEIAPIWQTELQGKVTPPVVAADRLFVAETESHQVTCLAARDGSRQWSYTADGPVDSPPTIHDGHVVFGCTDGTVYCLRATDGALVWRFHAAPSERRVVSYGRIESAWPVHGSVLIERGIVYFAAGRSSYLDGGINLYGLDVVTGEVRHQAHLDGPKPDLSVPSDRAHEMDGSKNDILVSNGEKLFLTQNVFDRELNPLEAPQTAKWGARQTDLRLVATGGFLDDSGFDRLFWMYARRWPGLYVADSASKAGQILVFDETTTYGLHTFTTKFSRSPYFAPGTEGHTLFADDNGNEPVLTDDAARRERGSMSRTQPPKWSVKIPVRARGMVLAGDTLFLAGPPDVIDPDDPHGAFEGRKGGRLWAVATADGSKLAEYPLDSPPVFDGLIAAQQKLFISTTDGVVSCWGGPADPRPSGRR